MPPFADFNTAQQFHRLLVLFLRELTPPGEPGGLPAYLLQQAVALHAPRGTHLCATCRPEHHREWPSHVHNATNKAQTYVPQELAVAPAVAPEGNSCRECGPPYPCRTVLEVATASRFPVPWTPAELIQAMKAVSLLTPDFRPNPSTTSFMLLDGDPIVAAEFEASSGNWIIHVVEHGQDRPERLADDDAFFDLLRDLVRVRAFSYPDDWRAAVGPGAAAAAREWWDQQEALKG